MCTFLLNSTPSSAVTDPPHLCTSPIHFATSILSVHYILENKSGGSSSCHGKLQYGWLQITTKIDAYIHNS